MTDSLVFGESRASTETRVLKELMSKIRNREINTILQQMDILPGLVIVMWIVLLSIPFTWVAIGLVYFPDAAFSWCRNRQRTVLPENVLDLQSNCV